MSEEREKIEKKKINFEREIKDFEYAIENLKNEKEECQNRLQSIEERLDLAKESEESFFLNFRYYEPNYFFQNDDNWQKMLNKIKSRQKSLLKRLPQYFFNRQPNENYGGIF